MTPDIWHAITATPIHHLVAWCIIVARLCIGCGDEPPAKIYETVSVELVCDELTCSAVFGQSVRVDAIVAPECGVASIRYMDASGVLHERPGVILEAVSSSPITLTVALETGCRGPMTAIVTRPGVEIIGGH